jgi:hypothetical protein
VASLARERITVDIRGLAPALKAHARAQHLSVSQAARLALLAALPPTQEVKASPAPEAKADAARLVKLTIRLRPCVAAQLSARARDSGLSQGAYLALLIGGTPPPPVAVANALADSTDQFALVAGSMTELVRLLHKDASPLAEEVRYVVRGLVDGTFRHLELASRLVNELRSVRMLPTRPARATASSRDARS